MTLTQAATFTRRFILFFLIFSILGLSAYIAYRTWYAHYLASIPPAEEKPDLKFGVLPAPVWPNAAASANNFTYSINTTTGLLNLEKFEKITKVYFIPKGVVTLLASQRGQNLANKLGINAAPTQLSEIRYQYKGADRTLTVDLDSGNFSYSKEATSTAVLAKNSTDQSDSKLISDFKVFLNNYGLMRGELQNGPSKVQYFKFSGTQLTSTSASEAQAYQISLWPQNINNKGIATPEDNRSLVHALVVNSADSLENYLSLHYTFWPVDSSTFATYPAKTADQAFSDLKAGKGVIIVAPPSPEVSITSVQMAYYETGDYTSYLEPIYIFEGPGFIAYTEAITEQNLSQTR